MASRREQILEAIRLKLATIVGITTYRSRLTALARSESPAVVVQAFKETVTKRNNNLSERELEVDVEVYARAQTPDQAADGYAVSAQAKVMEDQTLGGLCLRLREVGTQWLMVEADLDAVIVSTRYMIDYRTTATTLN